ncbi:MAG: hypothetical protein WCG34_01425 [Leptolinea sp.]
MEMKQYTLFSITLKTILVHTISYFLIGLVACTLFDYSAKYTDPSLRYLMRQTSHPMVAAGPLFQVLRGLLFGVVFYTLRDVVFSRKNGWLILWIMLLAMGVLSPFGPSPSSIEGVVYTTLPLWIHFIGLPEVIIQAFLLSFITYYWVNHPEKKWLGWVFGLLFIIAILMALMGVLAGVGLLKVPA